MPSKTRWCPRCKTDKPTADFYAGRTPYCKSCWASYQSQRRGFLSTEDREQLLADQGGVCAICGTDYPGPKGWQLDHDHHGACGCGPKKACNRCVRGLTCLACNLMLGHAKDSTTTLAAAWLYVIDHAVRRAKMKGDKG